MANSTKGILGLQAGEGVKRRIHIAIALIYLLGAILMVALVMLLN